jgi:peptide/nickel transport system permease protein
VLRYIAQRILQGIVVVWLVSIATFGIMQMAPGDPVDIMIGEAQVSQADIDAIYHKWGFDKPWYVQYGTWLLNMVTGDFGKSVIRTGEPVSEMLLEAAPFTLKLNLIALIVSVMIAVPIGVVAAVKRYTMFDYGSMVGTTFGVALPNFWVSLMLIIVFALTFRWLPPYGAESWKGYVLPVLVLASEQTAVIARLMRGTVIEVLGQDYVTTARAKGLSNAAVLSRHVLKNALLPVVTILGFRLAFILSGTIVIETVFALPGVGRLFIDSVFRLDYQVVQAIVLLLSVLVVVGNLITDLVYAYIDPRIRIG